MISNNKKILLFFAALGVVGLAMILISLVPKSQTNTETPQTITEEAEDLPADNDGLSDAPLINIELLEADYTDVEYMFILDSVLDFASTNFGQTEDIKIDPTSYAKRSNNQHGFNVDDIKDTNLFYVIVTRLPDNSIKVQEYLP